MSTWFARPVLFVGDVDRSLDFYVNKFGFKQTMRHAENGKVLVGGVERDGCELLISSQWPDKVGKGLTFISLTHDVFAALRVELEGNGVEVKDGWWGYELMVVTDPDGNELYFPNPNDKGAGA